MQRLLLLLALWSLGLVATPLVAADAAIPSHTPSTSYSESADPVVGKIVALAESGELANELLISQWQAQAPNAVPIIDPCPITLASNLSSYRGKNVAILFWTPEFTGPWFHSDIKNIAALKVAQKLDSEAKANKWKLDVVVVTNLSAKADKSPTAKANVEAKEFFAEQGINLNFICDPKGEAKLAMGIYSTPLMLVDARGNLVWKMRLGQRNDDMQQTGDLMEAARALGTGKYLVGPTNTLSATGDEGTSLFGFENGTTGWTLTGNAWGHEGTCSEKYYPGLVKGFLGRRWLSSFTADAMRGTGAAISPEFTLTKRYLHLLIGGGDLPTRQGVAVVCDGKAIKVAAGENTYEINPVTWDLKPWIGQKVRLVAYDNGNSEQRDGIMLDAVTASDYPGLPKGFADRHDPNNASHVARVAADLPEEWIALQNGEFHMSSKPGKTYEVTKTFDVDLSAGSGPIKVVDKKLPSTPAQTVSNYWGEIIIDGRSTKSTDTGNGWIKVEAKRPTRKDSKAAYIAHATVTVNTLTMEKGPSPEPPKLTPYFKKELSKNLIPEKSLPGFLVLRKREGLTRFPNERPEAYMLRVWRWIQRTWTNGEPWGGWPNPAPGTYVGDYTQRSMTCPIVGAFCNMFTPEGLPCTAGQGWWANNSGASCGPHVRALIPLEKAGWILIDDDKWVGSPFGQFTTGWQTGDIYFQDTYWPESKGREEAPDYTNVTLTSNDPQSAWKTREVQQDDRAETPATTGKGELKIPTSY